jgi:SAM-dependent methyltransferase
MTFERIKGASRKPTSEEIERDILDFHERVTGITERTLGECETADGLTGYDVVARAIPLTAKSVLELGCGNGPLLERLVHRGFSRVVGVDACRADAELAKARVPRAEILCARAQDADLGERTFDAACSHHAIYLFDPIEPVVAALARALRPGAPFVMATWSFEADQSHPFAEMMTVYGELTKRDNPHFTGWGDRRMFRRDGLDAIFGAAFEWAEVSEHALLVDDEPIRRLDGFFYSTYLQKEATRRELHEKWAEILAASGPVRFPFSLVTFRRR